MSAVVITFKGKIPVLCISGTISADAWLTEKINERIENLHNPPGIVLDMNMVSNITSSGLGVLLAIEVSLSGKGMALTLANVPGHIKNIVGLRKLENIFGTVYTTVDEAVAELQK
jgi:anti-anti-sigma factor